MAQTEEHRHVKRNITAICISANVEEWHVSDIPFYCHTEGFVEFPHYPPVKTRARILYLSSRRNAAHKRALEIYPNTEHFLSVDSYYLNFVDQARELVKEYSNYSDDCVLGATNWFLDHSRVPLKLRYWDTWATPEMSHKRHDYYPRHDGIPKGWEQVQGCGGFALYPRWVWERRGYGVPEPFPESGNEVNYLCQCPGVRSYVTFNVKVIRQTPTELVQRTLFQRIRTTLAIRTRLGLRKPPRSNSRLDEKMGKMSVVHCY